MEVICVANQKGGVGKTTICYHLAWMLHAAGGRVLVIDMDPQGNLSWTFGANDDLASAIFREGIIQKTTIRDRLDLVSSTTALGSQDRGFSEERALDLKRALQSESADIVLIDTPPTLGMFTVVSLIASSIVITPMLAKAYAIQGTVDLSATIELVQRKYNQNLEHIGYIVNSFERTTKADQQALELIRDKLGADKVISVIPKSIKVEEAIRLGKPVWEHEPNNPAARAFLELARLLTAGSPVAARDVNVASALVGETGVAG